MTAEFIVATHALVFLNHRKENVSSEEIAKNVCTNPARVRKVLAKLKKAGLIVTKGGMEGGYGFWGTPEKVTLQQVYEALETSMINIKWRSGGIDKDCVIASGMGEVMDDVFASVEKSCRQTLATITIADIDRRLFPVS